jgi:hypothetical protein
MLVEILPNVALDKEYTLHRMRVQVDAGGHSFVQESTMRPDDFESRFDMIFDMAKRTLRTAVEREAKHPQQTETSHGEAQEDTPGIHAQGQGGPR